MSVIIWANVFYIYLSNKLFFILWDGISIWCMKPYLWLDDVWQKPSSCPMAAFVTFSWHVRWLNRLSNMVLASLKQLIQIRLRTCHKHWNEKRLVTDCTRSCHLVSSDGHCIIWVTDSTGFECWLWFDGVLQYSLISLFTFLLKSSVSSCISMDNIVICRWLSARKT